jgi:hypothetical protein
MNEQDHQAPADESATPRPKSDRPSLPEPSLKTFVSGLAGQVLINLGLFDNPLTGKRQVDLEQAKYSIDLLQILQDKMQGNLTDEEAKLMSAILYDLRMRYVEACR